MGRARQTVKVTQHVPAIIKYNWTLGLRWRWDCSCGRGLGMFLDEEAAREGFETHLRGRAMWEAHEARRAREAEKSR